MADLTKLKDDAFTWIKNVIFADGKLTNIGPIDWILGILASYYNVNHLKLRVCAVFDFQE